MNEGKYRIHYQKMMKRQKANDYLKDLFNDHDCLFLQGIAGSGKTYTLFSFIQEFYHDRYIYFQLDSRDDHEDIFKDHFHDAFLYASHHAYINEHDDIFIDDFNKPYILVFDQFENITNNQVIQIIKYLIAYKPKYLHIIILSQIALPTSLYDLLQYNKLYVVKTCPLFFDKNETIKFHKTYHMKTDPIEIYQKTNGWPLITNDLCHHQENYIIYDFFKHIQLTQTQMTILKMIALTPYISINLLKTLSLPNLLQDITYLVDVSLITIKNDVLKTIPLYREYLKQTYESSFTDILNLVYPYYHKHHYISDLLFYYYYIQQDQLLSFIQQHDLEIGHLCSYQQLNILSNHYKDSQDIHILYIKGIVSFMQSHQEDYEQIVSLLEKQSHDKYVQERLLNLLYLSNQHNIYEIIQLKTPKISYDSLTGNYPSCLNGKRDLSNIMHLQYKDPNTYQSYKALCNQKEKAIINLAEIEYLLYTNQTQKCLERIELFIHYPKEKLPSDILSMMSSLLFQIYYLLGLKDNAMHFYQEYRSLIGKNRNDVLLHNNMNLYDVYCYCLLNEKEKAYDWYREENKDEVIRHDNYYHMYIIARIHYLMERYDQASYYFTKLESFFRKENRPLYLSECLFANSACLYALNNKERALHRITEAFTVAGGYRYVFPFITYGKYGLYVMKMYRKFMKSDEQSKKTYENSILTRSYDQYLKNIVKICEFIIKTYPSIEKTNYDQLTVKETAVLKCITKGYTNKEISEELLISLPTVKTHVSNILSKLGVKSRTQAIHYVKENNLLENND